MLGEVLVFDGVEDTEVFNDFGPHPVSNRIILISRESNTALRRFIVLFILIPSFY
jgi:hypothetical protein